MERCIKKAGTYVFASQMSDLRWYLAYMVVENEYRNSAMKMQMGVSLWMKVRAAVAVGGRAHSRLNAKVGAVAFRDRTYCLHLRRQVPPLPLRGSASSQLVIVCVWRWSRLRWAVGTEHEQVERKSRACVHLFEHNYFKNNCNRRKFYFAAR